MHGHYIYDYAVIRVIPKVEREEFINVGIIVSCPELKFLDANFEIDEQRLGAFDPSLDLELIKTHLVSIPVICQGGENAGPIGKLTQRERFHWLVAPRSTVIQTSSVHTGYCKDPADVLIRLMETMVRQVNSENNRNTDSYVV